MKKHITTFALLLVVIVTGYAQNTITHYQYYFDGQLSSLVQATVPSAASDITLNTDIDCSNLDNGLHTIHLRFGDNNNQWSGYKSSFFLKLPAVAQPSNHSIDTYEFWFDSDYTNKQVSTITSPTVEFTLQEIIPQGLEDGLHSFHLRFKDDSGQWSAVTSSFFLQVSSSISPVSRNIDAYEYWFDGDFTNKQTSTITTPATDFTLQEVIPQELEDGLHSFHIRYKDDSGQWSAVTSSFFLQVSSSVSPVNRNIDAYEYWFDGDFVNKQTSTIATPGTEYSLLEVTPQGLEDGLHSFHLRFKDESGQWSSAISCFILINTTSIEITPNLVSGFRYWYNGNFEEMKEINLVEPIDPHELVSYLKPSGLAIGDHTFHLQFKDTKNQWSSILSTTFTVTQELQNQHYFSRTSGNWNDPNIWVDEVGENLNSYPGKSDEVTIEGAEVNISNQTESGTINLNSNNNAASRLHVQSGGSLIVHGRVKIAKEDGNVYHGEIRVDANGNIECIEPTE